MSQSGFELAIGGFSAAATILKLLKDAVTASDARAHVSELYYVILSTQAATLEGYAKQRSLLDEIRNLEEQLARIRAWEEEKQRYRLHGFNSGSFAYALKPESARSEPAHHLCATCYNKGHKTILQGNRHHKVGLSIWSPPDEPGEFLGSAFADIAIAA